MVDKQMAREFEEYEERIRRLKAVEAEIDRIGTPEWREKNSASISVIRENLKKPLEVNFVEREFEKLKNNLKSTEVITTQQQNAGQTNPDTQPPVESSSKTDTSDFTEIPLYFPKELTGYFSDIELIGKGGFARIFKAVRKQDNQVVAIKIPTNTDPAIGKSFLKEMETWQRLSHDNIAHLIDCNVLPTVYLQIELCDGNLEILTKPLSVERAAFLMLEVSRGLKHAHSKGIIHRDLKPSNILMKNDVPKISDWGLSHIMAESRSALTHSTSMTPIYAAPEQFSQKKFGKVDKRTDIYQLGTIFYETVTGHPPFSGDDITEISYAITSESPMPPSSVNPEAANVDDIIMKCLAKRMDDRYQTIESFQKDTAAYLGIDWKRTLTMNASTMEQVKLCTDLIEIYASQGNTGGCLMYLKNLVNYVATPELKVAINTEIKALGFYQEQDVNIGEQLPKINELLHRARFGE